MGSRITALAFALLAQAGASSAALASPSCPQHFADGRSPQIVNEKLARNTQVLCYRAFGLMHSGATRTPLWSAEYLTPDHLDAAKTLSREDSFHPEPELAPSQRAELADYARSGFDRGHMAPNGDMPDRTSQHQSFSLANMVPQDADNNRHIWSGIEQAVRKMAKKEGGLYVITGPAFIGHELRKVGNVIVPSHLYKVVYSPRQNAAAAYFVANEADARYATISVAELESKVGINLLPALSARQKETMLRLPQPKGKS
jgi:endonuclease G